MRLLALLITLWLLVGTQPASAHLPVQLFQGVERHEGGVIRKIPDGFDVNAFPRMPGGLYQIPPEFHVEVELTSGEHQGEVVKVPHILFGNPSADIVPAIGERVIIGESRLADGSMLYKILDYDRRPALIGSTVLCAIALIVVGGLAGLKALLFAGGAIGALYLVTLPTLISGGPPPVVTALSAIALVFFGTWVALGRGFEARAALIGSSLGAIALLVTLSLTYAFGHVSGLASPDALVLYSQVKDARTLDYPALWLCGALLTALGSLLAMSMLTARAIGREPDANPWTTGMREGKTYLPAFVIGTGLLYFGLSLPLLLITHLGQVTPIVISNVRFMNYDYLVSVILAWEGGIIGLLAAWLGTCAAARLLKRPPVAS